MFDLLSQIGSSSFQYGALGFGWVLSVVFLMYFLRSLKVKEKELLEVKAQHINDIKQWASKIESLNDKQNLIVQDLSNKRIEDLKELVNDYNEIATDVATSLDRLANHVKPKRQN